MQTTRRENEIPEGPNGPSTAAVEALVRAFEDCTLPRERWDHGAHLLVGLWYVLRHGPERALALISRGIHEYNQAAGRDEAERAGFCAETTRLWIQRIDDFVREYAGEESEEALYRRILSGPLSD